MGTSLYAFNNKTRRIYKGRCQKSFEELLVDIDNVIDSAVKNSRFLFNDNILYSDEDIKQEVHLLMWLTLIEKEFIVHNYNEILGFIHRIIGEVLEQTRG